VHMRLFVCVYAEHMMWHLATALLGRPPGEGSLSTAALKQGSAGHPRTARPPARRRCYMYIHIYVYTYTYYTHTHSLTHPHARAHTHIHVCIYIHAYTYIHIYMYVYTYIRIYIRIYMRIYIRIYIRIYTHTCSPGTGGDRARRVAAQERTSLK